MAEGTSAIKCLLCTDEAELLDAESNKQREFKVSFFKFIRNSQLAFVKNLFKHHYMIFLS